MKAVEGKSLIQRLEEASDELALVLESWVWFDDEGPAHDVRRARELASRGAANAVIKFFADKESHNV